MAGSEANLSRLAAAVQQAHSAYAAAVARGGEQRWWTAVVITASGERQAEVYRSEIQRRQAQRSLPGDARFLVAPDPRGERIGSGTATLLAAREVCRALGADEPPESWWRRNRVLLIHSGGDARRLPAYSLAGKLFSALPVRTARGETSTLFDEMLALSSLWASRMAGGLVVVSGDVLLTFDADEVNWEAPGCVGVAMRQPAEVGTRHGVYLLGPGGGVYGFLQKPSPAQLRAAGGMLPGEQVAIDTGLLRFDAGLAAGLTRAGERCGRAAPLPVLDLYQDIMFALTGQAPPPAALEGELEGSRFQACLVEGEFTHAGTTAHFRRLMTEPAGFERMYQEHRSLKGMAAPGVTGAGVAVDCVFAGGARLEAGALAVECWMEAPFRAGRDSLAHGLTGIPGAVELPADTAAHQAAVRRVDGTAGWVIRVYGVDDDPKRELGEGATWFGRPMGEWLGHLGIGAEEVWAGDDGRSLWNARLFAVAEPAAAWRIAAWLMGLEPPDGREEWRSAERISLAELADRADLKRIEETRAARGVAAWRLAAVDLVQQGADVRPLLSRAPSLEALTEVARELKNRAMSKPAAEATNAAALYFQAFRFLAQAGYAEEGERERQAAFARIRAAAEQGSNRAAEVAALAGWKHESVGVEMAARVDFGGGWSDTPPFCFDWGGVVLNAAVTLDGRWPVRCRARRLAERVIRLKAGREAAEIRTTAAALAETKPGDRFAIARSVLRLLGVVREGTDLRAALEEMGGGVEIETDVDTPVGSGLGSSSILAAAAAHAVLRLAGSPARVEEVTDLVLRVEQMMGTGGGWQDQAGGSYRGVKLLHTGPGVRQRVRVEPVRWDEAKRREFHARFVVYDTGIQRIAVNLLEQVVGSYLARETHTVEVLHSLKTLAHEMRYAMEDGDWTYLGELLTRHWELNIRLDPNTTNAPIGALLEEVAPCVAGAKLAGAGGGGFLMMLARSEEAAAGLRERLRARTGPGRLVEVEICEDPVRVSVTG